MHGDLESAGVHLSAEFALEAWVHAISRDTRDHFSARGRVLDVLGDPAGRFVLTQSEANTTLNLRLHGGRRLSLYDSNDGDGPAMVELAGLPPGEVRCSASGPAVRPRQADRAGARGGPDAGATLDVLFCYTPRAYAEADRPFRSIFTAINRGLEYTREAYYDSEISLEINSVLNTQISYNESGKSMDEHLRLFMSAQGDTCYNTGSALPLRSRRGDGRGASVAGHLRRRPGGLARSP